MKATRSTLGGLSVASVIAMIVAVPAHAHGAEVLSSLSDQDQGDDATAQQVQPGAQETSPDSDVAVEVEEIVVTAQRQSQRLQDVPISITALTGDTLIDRGIRTTDDLNIAVPGLNVSRSISTGLVYLRGVGNNSTNPGQEPNVGFYVDGVYYATVVSDLSSFSRNVDHIEVLRGPQGTLFGRNTTGGLIQVVTRDPEHEFSGTLSAGYANYNTLSLSGYVTTGITSNLAADLSFNFSDQGDGWGRNIVRNEEAYYRDDLNVRTKWVWEPSNLTRLTFTADYNRIRSDLGSARQILEGIPRTPALLGSIVFNGNIFDTQANSPVFDRIKGGGVALRVDHEAGPFRLVNIAAYRRMNRTTFLDLDTTPGNRSSAQYNPQEATTFSEEFQILSPTGSHIQWIAGAYYFYADDGVHPLQIFNAALGPALYQRIDASLITNSFAIYAQATIPLFGENTNLTLGGRYTIDDKDVIGRIDTALANLAIVNTGQSFSQPTFRVALDHRINPEILLYASINTGFKSGLYNATSPTSPPVEPETITAYEAGIKTDLFDRRLRFNVSGFYYDYKDLQLTRFTGTSTQLQNAATARVYGLELESVARVTPGLTVTGALSLLHSEYTSFPNAVSFIPNAVTGLGVQTIIDASGNRLQRTPSFTANSAIDYRRPIGNGTIGLNLSYYYNGGFFFEPDNFLKQDAYSLVNTEVSWAGPNDRYRVRLWARNLFDQEFFTLLSIGNGQPPVGSAGAPRTYGVSVDFNF